MFFDRDVINIKLNGKVENIQLTQSKPVKKRLHFKNYSMKAEVSHR